MFCWFISKRCLVESQLTGPVFAGQVDLNMLTSLASEAPPPSAGLLPLQLGPVDPVSFGCAQASVSACVQVVVCVRGVKQMGRRRPGQPNGVMDETLDRTS